MSYYAHASGDIKITNVPAAVQNIDALKNEYDDKTTLSEYIGILEGYISQDTYLYTDASEDALTITGHNDNFYEEEIKNILRDVAPYCEDGNLDFEGEDNTYWQYVIENHVFREVPGAVTYNAGVLVTNLFVNAEEERFSYINERAALIGLLTEFTERELIDEESFSEDMSNEQLLDIYNEAVNTMNDSDGEISISSVFYRTEGLPAPIFESMAHQIVTF